MGSQIVRQDLATEHQQQFIMFCFPMKVTRVTSFAYMHLCCQSDVSAKEYSNYHITTLISHTSKVMLKILQTRLQQYMN